MTEFNQNPMNTNQRSKAPLVLFIVCILVLAIIGGYFAYAKSLGKTADVAQLNEVSNLVEDNTATANATDQSTATANPVPADWKEYELTNCEIKIKVPSAWRKKSVNEANIAFNSPETVKNIKKDVDLKNTWEGYSDLYINCYDSVKEFAYNNGWSLMKEKDSNFSDPKDLYDALTRKKIGESLITVLNTQDVKEVQYNNKGYEAFYGGIGSTNTYFERPSKIVEFATVNYDQNRNLNQPQKEIVSTFEWLN